MNICHFFFWKSWYSSNCQHHCQQGSVNLQQLVVASAEVLEKSQIFQKCAKCTLTLMSNYEINFLLQIQILHIKIEWNLPSLSLALFFFIHNEFLTGWLAYGTSFQLIQTQQLRLHYWPATTLCAKRYVLLVTQLDHCIVLFRDLQIQKRTRE